jgi:hypothetical protein
MLHCVAGKAAEQLARGEVSAADHATLEEAYRLIDERMEWVEAAIAAHAHAPVVLFMVQTDKADQWRLSVVPLAKVSGEVRELEQDGLLTKSQADRVLTPTPPGQIRLVVLTKTEAVTSVIHRLPR